MKDFDLRLSHMCLPNRIKSLCFTYGRPLLTHLEQSIKTAPVHKKTTSYREHR